MSAAARALASKDLPPCDLGYINTMAAGHALSLLQPATPVITHVHELDFQLDLIEYNDADSVRALLARTSHYIAVSEHVVEVLRSRYGVRADRITKRYGFLPERALTVSPERVKAERGRLDISRDALVVGSVGAVEWRKGADLFLELARQLIRSDKSRPDLKFIWVGAANEYFWQRAIRHDLGRVGLDDRLRFVGPLADPSPTLGLMDVFVLPSRSDPFPLSALEAAALGKPVVSFDAGGMAEFLEGEERLVLPYLDVPAMAARTSELLASQTERDRIGGRLSSRVREHHLLDDAAPALLDLIDRVASQARGGLRIR